MNWISVKERLPEPKQWVLCARKQMSMSGYDWTIPSVGMINSGSKRFTCEMDWVRVTHWMPLPEPPKEHQIK